jgi:aarF domain-containing kinase
VQSCCYGANDVQIPTIHWKYSTDRVLVMQFCEGRQVNDRKYLLEHNISPDQVRFILLPKRFISQVCDKIGEAYSEMIFRHGYVHCDPHPGNILVRNNPDTGVEIVLLDHGLYAVN